MEAIELFIQRYKIKCKSQIVVIIGRSFLIGSPVRDLFQSKESIVTVVDENTDDINSWIAFADILVLGTGQELDIDNYSIKKDCIIFDVGIRVIETDHGKQVVGDIDVI